MKAQQAIFFVLALFITIGCGNRNDGQSCQLDGNCSGGPVTTPTPLAGTISTLACTVTPDKTRVIGAYTSGTTLVGGEKLGLTITATGGSGSYAVPNFVTSFTGSTTVFGYYKNDTSADIAVTKTVNVTDTNGSMASCSFNVTIAPASKPTGNLACVITPSNYNPQVGETVNFTINAWTWAPSSNAFTFGQFLPRQGEPPKALSAISGNTATVSYVYTSTWLGRPDLSSYNGSADPAVSVTNGADLVWCQLPYRYMTVSPATPGTLFGTWTRDSSDYDNLIKVDLNALGFGTSTPITYTAAIQSSSIGSSAGIQITQDSNSANSDLFSIKRIDTDAHDFVVRFTATNGTKTASKDVELTFATSINCSMTAPLQVYANVEADFVVGGTHGELIDISDIAVTGGAVISSKVNGVAPAHAKVTFPSIGYYSVSVKAQKTSSSILCNNGSVMTAYVYVNPAPSTLTGCDVKANLNRTRVGSPVRIDVVKKGGQTDMNSYLVTVNPNGTSPYSRTSLVRSAYLNGIDTSSIDLIYLDVAESVLISASIRESSTGRTVNCQSYISVDPNAQGLKVNVFDIARNFNNPLTFYKTAPSLSAYYVPAQPEFTAANIDVSARRYACDDWKQCHRDYSPECGYPGVKSSLKEWYLVEYTGRIYIPASYSGSASGDLYQFKFQIDDGVMLYLDEDLNNPVVNFDGVHAPQFSTTGSKYLTPGYHSIRVRYFQGPRVLIANQFYWKNASISGSGFSIVPAANFYQP